MMKPCRKCLLSRLDEGEFYRSVQERIAAIPADLRVDEDIYRQRLAECQKCEQLTNGMCGLCGCYVELRAVKPKMYCPAEQPLWLQA